MAQNRPGEGWALARNFDDLAQATIDFLVDPEQPGYLDSPVILSRLVQLNRMGLVTTASQPGQIDEDGGAWRAYFAGLCLGHTAKAIVEFLARTDLVTVLFLPGDKSEALIPVSVHEDGSDDGGGWLGNVDVGWEVDRYRNGNPELDEHLDQTCFIQVFDPVWGRDEALWPTLVEALERVGEI